MVLEAEFVVTFLVSVYSILKLVLQNTHENAVFKKNPKLN